MNRILGYLTGFTSKFYLGVIVGLIVLLPLSYCKGRADGRDLTEAKYAAARAEALAQAREADGVATATAQAGKDAVAASNQAARDAAAADPDDPLKAGLDSIGGR